MPSAILATKICTTCCEKKTLNLFSKRTKSLDGFDQYCKTCKSLKRKAVWALNPDQRKVSSDANKLWRSVNREKYLKVQNNYYYKNRNSLLVDKKEYRVNNLKKITKNNQEYYKNNRIKLLDYFSKYRKENRQKCNEWSISWQKLQLEINPLFQLQRNIRSLIRGKIRAGGYTKRSKTTEILGCDWELFKFHIESQFVEGMSWSIFGSKIHIDHIIPMTIATTEAEVLALNHYTNLQPLWALDNIRKGAKLDWVKDGNSQKETRSC